MAQDITVVLRRNLIKALRRGDLADARSALCQLVDRDPLSVETRGLEMEVALVAGEYREAGVLATQLLTQFPRSPRIRLLAGRLATKLRDFPTAVHHLRESERLHSHWRTRRDLASALTSAGELDEAEALLIELVSEHPRCRVSLAWVYERKQDVAAAIAQLEKLLERGEDAYARSMLLRLRGASLDAEEVKDEVEVLVSLDQAPPPELLPRYFDVLLAEGSGEEARAFYRGMAADLDPRIALQCAWPCYRRQAYDLAYDMFVRALPRRLRDVKLLSALDVAARRAGRVEELMEVYGRLAETEPRLHGRVHRLARLAESAQ